MKDYAYAKDGDYRLWPGPNSNRPFVATISARGALIYRCPLPPTAIGKDFRVDYSVAGWTPSRTGAEIEILGLLGVKAGWVEGFEINFFTLVAGLDIRNPALKLPGFGRIGLWRRQHQSGHAGRAGQSLGGGGDDRLDALLAPCRQHALARRTVDNDAL